MTVFLTVIVVLGWIFGRSQGFGYSGIIIAVIIAIVLNLISYFKGDKIALSLAKAKPIKKEANPYVYRMVENLCIASGLPMPRVYLIVDKNINAFACGRNPETASVAITTGAIEKLQNEELEGVIAHELSHIKNYDIRVMTIVIICVGIITLMADFFLRANFLFGRKSRDNNNTGVIFMIVGLILALLSPLFAALIQLSISRKREYLADASSALLTRYPEGLAKALEKIANSNTPEKQTNKAIAHLYIANPFSAKGGPASGWEGAGKKITSLFSTHPPIEDRIKKLRQMA